MARGEEFYSEMGIGAEPKRKIDVSRIKRKRGAEGNNTEADFELAEKKIRFEKIARNKRKIGAKKANGYTGGKGLLKKEKTDNDSGQEKETIKEAVENEEKSLETGNNKDIAQEAKIENPDDGEPKRKRPVVRGSGATLEKGELDATDEMMREERARIATLHGVKEDNRMPQEEKPKEAEAGIGLHEENLEGEYDIEKKKKTDQGRKEKIRSTNKK